MSRWLSRGVAVVGVGLLMGHAFASEQAVPGGPTAAIRQLTTDLGYAPEVGESMAAFASTLPCDAWCRSLEAARRISDSSVTTRAELSVSDDIRRRLDAAVRHADGDSPYWNLPDVMADRKAQCLGHAQLWHLLGRAVGLDVTVVEVCIPAVGDLAEHETHVATFIHLADGRTRFIDTRVASDDSPFRFASVYRRDGASWRRAELAGRRRLPRKVRPLDTAGVEAAVLLSIANTYRRAGREAQAAPLYDRALALDPGSVAIRLAVAETAFARGLWDESERRIEEAIRLDPDCSSAHASLGRLRSRQNRFPEAVEALDRAIALKPNSPDAIRWRAEATQRLAPRP